MLDTEWLYGTFCLFFFKKNNTPSRIASFLRHPFFTSRQKRQSKKALAHQRDVSGTIRVSLCWNVLLYCSECQGVADPSENPNNRWALAVVMWANSWRETTTLVEDDDDSTRHVCTRSKTCVKEEGTLG